MDPLSGNGIMGRGRDRMFEARGVRRVEVQSQSGAERENDKRDRRRGEDDGELDNAFLQ